MVTNESCETNGTGWEMDTEFTHLLKRTADIMRKNDNALRVWCAREDKFFMHSGFERAVASICAAISRPRSNRPYCLAVTGLPNSGKTTLVRRVIEDLETGSLKVVFEAAEKPVISFEMPGRATEASVALLIASTLGLNGYARSTSRLVTDQYKRALKAKNVQVIIIDEFHNVKSLPDNEREILFNCLKGIINSGIHIIAVGTYEVCVQIAADEQLASRFHHEPLVPISEEGEFDALLASLEMHYPLAKPSQLTSYLLSEIIRRRTDCVLGNVVGLCNEAAAMAIEKGNDCIDATCLRDARWKPISEFKHSI